MSIHIRQINYQWHVWGTEMPAQIFRSRCECIPSGLTPWKGSVNEVFTILKGPVRVLIYIVIVHCVYMLIFRTCIQTAYIESAIIRLRIVNDREATLELAAYLWLSLSKETGVVLHVVNAWGCGPVNTALPLLHRVFFDWCEAMNDMGLGWFDCLSPEDLEQVAKRNDSAGFAAMLVASAAQMPPAASADV